MGHALHLHLGLVRPGIVRLGLVAVACVLLAGCGRKGYLEPPPGSPQSQTQQAQSTAQQARLLDDQGQPGLLQSPNRVEEEPADVKLERAQRKAAEAGAPRAINAPAVAKKSTFVLDPLL